MKNDGFYKYNFIKTVFLSHFLRKKKAKKEYLSSLLKYSACDRIRTHDLLVRSQTLYPAELRTHINYVASVTQQMLLYHLFSVCQQLF